MMQADPPRRGPLNKAVPLLALVAIVAFAGLVYQNEFKEDAPESRPTPIAAPSPHVLMPIPDGVLSARPALVIGSYPGREPLRPAEFAGLVRGTIEEIDATDDEERTGMVDSLGRLFRTDGDALVSDPDGAEAFASLALEAEGVLVDLVLGDPAPRTREYAAMALGPVAYAARLEAPPRKLIDGLVRHLEATTPEGFGDDKVREEVGVYTFVACSLLEYARGPELIFRLFMDRHPKFSPALSMAAVALGAIQLLPSTMPRLIEGLSSEDGALCGFCLVSLQQMGRKAAPALPRLVALIREELDRKWPRDQGPGGPGVRSARR
ncbi:hypothetical protein [Singulisphaera sp. PoT]|uniref:hypothetical protein n=1 Tax=Singulisphaera sp. PoT TaxID=3411797 RepID=UPI003BF591F0